MAIFCVFDRIGYHEPKQFQSKWPRWFFLVHWNTFLPQSKQNSKFQFFAFLQVPMGVRGIFRPPVQGGSSELISKFLSPMILYNHPSYFKSGEINSCRLSPLPNNIQIMNVYDFNGTNIFMRWKMKCSIQLGFASLNGTFHLSPNENICSIARMRKHSLFVLYNLYKDSNS